MPQTGTNSSSDHGVRNPCIATMTDSQMAAAVATRKKTRSTIVEVGSGCCICRAKRRWLAASSRVLVIARLPSPPAAVT